MKIRISRTAHACPTRRIEMNTRALQLIVPTCIMICLISAPNADAATVIAAYDDHSRTGTTAGANGLEQTSTTTLAVGSISGSADFFRSYLTFDLSGESQATAVTVTLTTRDLNESNTTTTLNQNLTLFLLASNWDSNGDGGAEIAAPGPLGTNLATFNVTPGGNYPDDSEITFSSTALTNAFNAVAGSGNLYLGVRSPEAEAAASGTRSFIWISSLEANNDDAGRRPRLEYTPVPAPAALPAGLAMLGLIAARRRRA